MLPFPNSRSILIAPYTILNLFDISSGIVEYCSYSYHHRVPITIPLNQIRETVFEKTCTGEKLKQDMFIADDTGNAKVTLWENYY